MPSLKSNVQLCINTSLQSGKFQWTEYANFETSTIHLRMHCDKITEEDDGGIDKCRRNCRIDYLRTHSYYVYYQNHPLALIHKRQ